MYVTPLPLFIELYLKLHQNYVHSQLCHNSDICKLFSFRIAKMRVPVPQVFKKVVSLSCFPMSEWASLGGIHEWRHANFKNFWPPAPPSVTLKWLFYSQLYWDCRTRVNLPSLQLRDVIYEWSLIYWILLFERAGNIPIIKMISNRR